jgi:hypothetical protein
MIEALFHAYAATLVSQAVRDSRWIFAVAEIIHLVGLSLVGGAVLIVSARLAGWPIGTANRAGVWRGLRWVIVAGLIVQIASGIVLVGVNPLKYYFNPAFNVKLWLLLAAGAVGILTDRLVGGVHLSLTLWRAIALLLAGLWLGVAIAGRAIGLL